MRRQVLVALLLSVGIGAEADVLVYTHNVSDYGAKPASEDNTAAFQKALDAALEAGGGIVYAPAGRYAFKGQLVVPPCVMLRGDWARPGADALRGRTILRVFGGKGRPDGPDFILVKPGGCVRDLTVHYPEQSFGRPVAYPPTIALSGNAAAAHLTLVNPWCGIRGVPSSIVHYVKDCYGTPLHEGIWIDVCTDVGRIIETQLAPEYWEQSGLPGSPTTDAQKKALRDHLMKNAVGVRIGYSDAEHLTNLRVSGYKTGLWLTRRTDGKQTGLTVNSYGEASGIELENCAEALRCDSSNHIVGWRFSSSRFAGRDTAVVGTGGSTLQFAGCRFAATDGPAVRFPNKADVKVYLGFREADRPDLVPRTGMTFHACRFEDWKGVAIDARSGKLSVTDSDFEADKTAATLAVDLVAATFVGNRFRGKPRIENKCPQVALDHEAVRWDRVDLSPHVYAPDPEPRTDAVLNVRDTAYGAVANGKADDSPAIQNALDAAARKGGTVLLPAGIYRCAKSLSVPPGVELRGIGGPRPDRSLSGLGGPGTMLYAVGGRGQPDGEPFIRLGKRSGLRGVRIAHPGLFDLDKVAPYPWTVLLDGERAYVLDVCLNNSHQGIDVRSDRHLVRNVLINTLKLAVRVRDCEAGVIEDVHIHPQYVASLLKLFDPAAPTTGPESARQRRALYNRSVQHARRHATCFELGACRAQRFVNPSTWPPDVGFRVTSPKAEAHILNCTLETHAPLWLDQAKRIELVNANAPVVGIRTGAEFAGEAHVINYLLRVGHRPRECLDLRSAGTIWLTQCWFKWIPQGGQEMLFKSGDLRLLGGMMVDVAAWKRGKGRMSLAGVIGNQKLFGPELKAARASVGVMPYK
jgi:hypothetical protein